MKIQLVGCCMSSFAGPDLVDSNLILQIDAFNTKSYPGSGTTWNDISGRLNNFTLINGPSFSTVGGSSIKFDGTNDFAEAPDNSIFAFGTANFSISAWINVQSASSAGVVCNKAHYGANGRSWELYIYESGGLPYVWFGVFNGTSWTYCNSTANIFSYDSWTHIVVTSDGAGNGKVYINGSITQTNNTFNTTIATTTCLVQVGGYREGAGSPGALLNGYISNLQIYNKAMTSTEVLQNYNSMKSRFFTDLSFNPTSISGNILWLDAADSTVLFQNNDGSTPATSNNAVVGFWRDKSPSGANVTQATAGYKPLLKTNVKNQRNVVRFDGTDDFLSGALGVTPSNYTLFVICEFSVAGLYPMIFTGGNNNELRLFSNSGRLEMISQLDPLVRSANSVVSFPICISVVNGSSFAMYINGISQGTAVTQNALTSSFYVSSRSGTNYYFNGDLYEIIIYNSALSDYTRNGVEQYLISKWGTFY